MHQAILWSLIMRVERLNTLVVCLMDLKLAKFRADVKVAQLQFRLTIWIFPISLNSNERLHR